MTSRILLVAASLCAALAPIGSASAQNAMPLRASYQGKFLPEGTEIIILSKEGRVQRDGRYQPEFFPTRDFPRDGRRTLRRDRLDDAGLSTRKYDGTQGSGRLYFIYALAPDSTLYWSYSAQRDSLKYDVVTTGVMSVAPVPGDEIRDEILGRYFRQRITVVMRGEDEGDEETVAAAAASIGGDLQQESVDAAAEATELPTAEAATSPAAQDTSLASSSASRIAAAAAPPPVRSAAPGFSPFAFWSVLILLLGASAVPAYLARTYYAELKQVRREMLTLRSGSFVGERAGGGNDAATDEEYAQLRTALDDARLRCEQLEEDYDILEARYAALEKEIDASGIRDHPTIPS